MNFRLILSALFSVFLILSSCDQPQKSARNRKQAKTKKVVNVPVMNADSAFAYVAKQVSFGPRISGTPEHKACADWIIAKANEFADTVYIQRFKARTYDKVTRNGVNIIASFKPEKKQRVLLMAHWDSRPFADHDTDESNHSKPIDGANDGASGVGILLEVARQMKSQPADVGIDIVFFDLEDWGPPQNSNIYGEENWGLGSQHWSKNQHIYGYNAMYGILLDMAGGHNPAFRIEYFSKKYARYVVDLVWNTAADLGYAEYFINEDGMAATDDHYFVNEHTKIPSIDIIHQDFNNGSISFFEHWHTSKDNLEAISPETLRMVGEVVLTVVYNE